ncbi:MAG: TRAP transporter substrate-binding protein [Deltaproteobacteria bacterium]|nr:TRAP transporter substrate-binding protein [Deltaproteobacteria bacterium]
MKYTRSIISFVIVCFVFLMSGSSNSLAGPTTLRLGGINAPKTPITRGQYKFAELVNQKTSGAVKVEVFPASQLGKALVQIEGVQLGTQDMFGAAVDWYAELVKDWRVLSMGFVFKDFDHVRAFEKSEIYKDLKAQLLKKGLRVVSDGWFRMPRVFMGKKPIKTPDDLKGLKMRVPNIATYLKVWEGLGARPTRIAWGEVYMALKQGVVDACEGPLDAIYGMKFFEAAPNIVMTNHLYSNANIVMSEKKFQSLEAQFQKAILEAGREAGVWYTRASREKFEKDKPTMIAAGAKFLEVNPKPFVEKLRPVVEKLEAEGFWRKGLYWEIQKLAK